MNKYIQSPLANAPTERPSGFASCPVKQTPARPVVRGKFIFVGKKKLYVRGVTYGTFRPDADGDQFPRCEIVEHDFALMTANGINAIRTYTVPPLWLLDTAQKFGLFVMVGLPWEQHITFLSEAKCARSIEERVREGVRACAAHPAVLCYSIGNEIPSPIVRWHGRRKIEKFLKKLYRAAKDEDPQGLVTYVNYPSTEYLSLPFVDIFCFNVYLEAKQTLEVYLARLQNLAGNRPLLMAEIGLDSRRNGLDQQAQTLDWQIRATFAAGCCGAFVFAWTDEWYRGGFDIEDWDFGLVTRDRQPKPALATMRAAFTETPFAKNELWPRISVIICTYNGSRTLRETFSHVQKIDYPNYEIILVDDGSRDDCAAIALDAGVRLISTNNRGLSSARNTGMEAADGEIVVYLDDDAYPDPHWLTYLAATFHRTKHAAVGGPNLAPPGDGDIAECVVNAPGGPVQVLLSDTEAEHIPGCNMAFRKRCLQTIGGFDPTFRVAGDDVDVCWRIHQHGWTIGFSHAAVVWHHCRNSVSAYLRQQQGYGKAEALLERKWPEKYNSIGHIQWLGRLYGSGLTRMLFNRQHVYHGPWGSAPFQTLREFPPTLLSVLPTMPEWYLVIIALGGLSALTLLWPKLVFIIPLLALAAGATVWQAILSSAEASFPSSPNSRMKRAKLYSLTAFLHLMQPLARLWGRARHGLTALRQTVPHALIVPLPKNPVIWSETWRAPDQALELFVRALRNDGAILLLGSDYDRWDLEVRGGVLGAARLFMTVEEHGAGKQLFRFRLWPIFNVEGVITVLVLTALALGAALDQFWLAYDVLAVLVLMFLGRMLFETSCAMAAIDRALKRGLEEKK